MLNRLTRTLTFLCAICLVAAGCSSSSSTTSNHVYTSSHKTISVKNGDEFTIKIAGNATTPYRWELSTKNFPSAQLRIVKKSYVQNKASHGEVGVGGNFTFVFKTKKPGNTKVVFNNVYVGNNSVADTRSYSVDVNN